jgi:hypothetical protein
VLYSSPRVQKGRKYGDRLCHRLYFRAGKMPTLQDSSLNSAMPKILIIDELGKENFGSDRHRYRQLISTCTMHDLCLRAPPAGGYAIAPLDKRKPTPQLFVSPTTPTLANPVRGFGLTANPEVSTDTKEIQFADER